MPDWIAELAMAVVAAILTITLHEAAHGYAALWLGDDTARQAGRLSLNPLRHVDPIGTLLVPGILLVGQLLTIGRVEAMFGWAKPVPVAAWKFPHPLRDMGLVAAAGPLMNFLLALLAAAALWLPEWAEPYLPVAVVPYLYRFLLLFVLSNLVLGLFNLLPLPPLDGGRILAGVLPTPLALAFLRVERYGIVVVLFLLLVLPRLQPGLDPVGWMLNRVVGRAFQWVLMVTGHPMP